MKIALFVLCVVLPSLYICTPLPDGSADAYSEAGASANGQGGGQAAADAQAAASTDGQGGSTAEADAEAAASSTGQGGGQAAAGAQAAAGTNGQGGSTASGSGSGTGTANGGDGSSASGSGSGTGTANGGGDGSSASGSGSGTGTANGGDGSSASGSGSGTGTANSGDGSSASGSGSGTGTANSGDGSSASGSGSGTGTANGGDGSSASGSGSGTGTANGGDGSSASGSGSGTGTANGGDGSSASGSGSGTGTANGGDGSSASGSGSGTGTANGGDGSSASGSGSGTGTANGGDGSSASGSGSGTGTANGGDGSSASGSGSGTGTANGGDGSSASGSGSGTGTANGGDGSSASGSGSGTGTANGGNDSSASGSGSGTGSATSNGAQGGGSANADSSASASANAQTGKPTIQGFTNYSVLKMCSEQFKSQIDKTTWYVAKYTKSQEQVQSDVTLCADRCLFHRAILLSGSALSSWALVEEPVIYSLQIARQMNCTAASDKESFQNHERIIDCLREIPIAELMKAKIVAPTFLSAFGPSVDGVVIKTNYQEEILANILPELKSGPGGGAGSQASGGGSQIHANSKPRDSKSMIMTNKYDLLFGCVTSEALWRFSHNDIQSGFEGDRRDRILRTYVRNTYNYHLSEIFYTIVNEYTDWERTVLHPINTRDSTIAALSDAQFVAPLVQTGDLFSRSSGHTSGSSGGSASNLINSSSRTTKTFFYVFDYQTKDGDYPQRMGTVHGEELPYIFGAPLTESSRNFTKSEISLSEALMIYIGNFARSGNPNEYQKQEPVLVGSKERNRFRGTLWEEYDPIHQKYLEIGIKPKVKNHFRAHQLSVWLRLIPELHRAGMEDVSLRHNMFRNHEGDLYDGVVKTDRFNNANANTRRPLLANNGSVAQVIQSITTLEPFLTTCVNVPSLITTSDIATYNASDVNSTGEPHGLVTYTATLGLTIAIGCTLLVLNVLIFAGVYYQRDKTRMEIKNLQEQQLQHQQQLSSNSSSPYGSKTIPRGYQPGSIMLDIEPDTASMILNTGATLPKSSQHGFKYPTNLATLPRHYQSKSHIIKNGDHICEGKSLHTFSENCVNSPPNGSIIMPPSALPKPPPPPKSSPPPESQPLLHTGPHHLSNSIQPHQKGGILKVPAAAISEMRV